MAQALQTPGWNLALESVKQLFGRNLDRLLKKSEVSQVKLAKAIGVRPEMIWHYKKGRHLPSDKTIDAISKYLQVHPSELFTLDPDIQKYRAQAKAMAEALGFKVSETKD